MNKESALYGAVGILVGVLLMGFIASYAVNTTNNFMMGMMGMRTMKDNAMTMREMTDSLRYKHGDSFDEAFIAGMIVHHKGAIEMANVAKNNAGHSELKAMADDIVAAQSKEIRQMEAWLKAWGYGDNDTNEMKRMEH